MYGMCVLSYSTVIRDNPSQLIYAALTHSHHFRLAPCETRFSGILKANALRRLPHGFRLLSASQGNLYRIHPPQTKRCVPPPKYYEKRLYPHSR